MAQKLFFILFASALFLLFDWYVFQSVKTVIAEMTISKQRLITLMYWAVVVFFVVAFLVFRLSSGKIFNRALTITLVSSFFVLYLGKLFVFAVMLIGDIGKLVAWTGAKAVAMVGNNELSVDLARNRFLSQLALVAGAIPIVSLVYGITVGRRNYKVHKMPLLIKNLPSQLESIKIVQISDIHVGSYFDRASVQKGIDLILAEQPDIIFFTGDMVNNFANEMEPYFELFKQIKAPYGVYSVLGNHDYGDYVYWENAEAKLQNIEEVKMWHKKLGWDLLLDEHRILQINGAQLAVIGVQNWSERGNFPKYGNLQKATAGLPDDIPQLLLSHDPSHWRGEVLKKFPAVDVMFAGHTHGMQFGVEVPGIKWSPVQYIYKEWAGLYQEGSQQLYVNRGFGFIGYPGRIGIHPEISSFSLAQA
jgi:predicted MPP superfamily phosphohydrolase